MPAKLIIEPGTEWTSPENRGVCGFCGGEEGGYAKKDAVGNWQPACWRCVKPKKSTNPVKKVPINCPPMEDLDLDSVIKPRQFIFEVPRMSKKNLEATKLRKRKIEETTDKI